MADVQAFINAAAQVEKCVRRVGMDWFPQAPADPPLRAVRNFEEHWENPHLRTLAEVKGGHDGELVPGTFTFANDDFFVARLSMRGTHTWILEVRDRARELLVAAGTQPATARHHLIRAAAPRKRTSML